MALTIFFFIILLLLIPMFSIFVQTIKNLLVFVAIVLAVAANLMLFYGIEFFPIFLGLVYVGAIVVTTLFMVLTFDLRAEYSKKIFHDNMLSNIF